MRILIAGFSTRAIAESAVRSGADVVTLDYFGDRDQRALVENHSLLRDYRVPFSAQALLQASLGLPAEGLVYISNLENHPDVLKQMSEGRTLLGNSPETLRQVRDWGQLREFLSDSGFACPITLMPGEEPAADAHRRWLIKPVESGGGHGVEWWSGAPLQQGQLLQEFVEGLPASVSFVADGRRAVMVGLSEQLIGRRALGARGFTWCGNIVPADLDPAARTLLLATLQRLVDQLTTRFGLRGLNGLDLVLAPGASGVPTPCLVEVNPRYTASMELVESAYGLNPFELHLQAMKGLLPEFRLDDEAATPYFGKAIVFAEADRPMPDTSSWASKGRRDIPFTGEPIQRGHPICTVLARGSTRSQCWEALLGAADSVQADVFAGRGVTE